VAHEALLRKWPLLRSWLDAAQEFLIGKQQLEQDLRGWEAAPEKDKSGAVLTGLKLNRARGWLTEHPTQLTAQGRAFIHASVENDEAEKHSRERTRRITMWGSIAAAVVLAVVAGWAVWELFRAQESERQANVAKGIATANESRARESEQKARAAQKSATDNESRALESDRQARAARKIAIANESRALTGLSQAASLQGHYTDAVNLALAAWPRSAGDERPQLSRTIDALRSAVRERTGSRRVTR
jgi:hypothetical protein